MAPKKKTNGSKCSVKYCRNKSTLTTNVSYFNYPKHVPTRTIWMHNCKTQGIVESDPNKKCRLKVCSDHFEPTVFTNNVRKRLAYNAVPTIFNDEILSMRQMEEISADEEHNISTDDNSVLMKPTLASETSVSGPFSDHSTIVGCSFSQSYSPTPQYLSSKIPMKQEFQMKISEKIWITKSKLALQETGEPTMKKQNTVLRKTYSYNTLV